VSAAVPTATSTWPAGIIQGSPPTAVTVDGSAFFSSSTVALSGFTPASTVSVTDGTSATTRTFFLPAYTSTSSALRLPVSSPLPSGTANTAYSATLAAAGGTGPYTYALAGGMLPTGVSIANGVITGTPTNAGTFLSMIQVTDSSTPPVRTYSQVELTIDPGGA